jgi:hypothetical protein
MYGLGRDGSVTANVSADPAAAYGAFVLQIDGHDGTTNPESSVAVNVTVTPAPLNATYSVLYSNIDPNAHTGRTATLIAAVTGGTPPYTYQWSGGGVWQGNRLAMTSPLLDTSGTLTISDSSQSPPLSIPATIKIAPVVSEEALYVSVLQRVLAMDKFGAALAAEGKDGTAVQSQILNQANLVQPTLTPDQFNNLVLLARQFGAERSAAAQQFRPLLTGLNGQSPTDQRLNVNAGPSVSARFLGYIKSPVIGLGSSFGSFSNFAWANYAPSVARLSPAPAEEDFLLNLYVDHVISEDPGTGDIAVWASAHLENFSLGFYGNWVDLTLSLYHAAGGDEQHFVHDLGLGFVFLYTRLSPGHTGDIYQSDVAAQAVAYREDGTNQMATLTATVAVRAYPCIPIIRNDAGGFTVDGVPTNGFVAGPGSGRSGSITIYGQCMDDVTQITFSGLPGLTATRNGSPAAVAGSPIPGLQTLSASYQASDAGLSADPAAAMWGYMVVSTADGRIWAHPAVLAKKLPAITSVIPYPWQSGSVVPYTIYGAGFGANPTVSIVLDNQATVGQPVVTKCVPVACRDFLIEGTVALPSEVVPDWATVTVGYAGYLSFVPQAPPPGGQGAARVPIVPAPGGATPPQFTLTSVEFTNTSYQIAADLGDGNPNFQQTPIDSVVWRSSCAVPPCTNPSAFVQGTMMTANVTLSLSYAPVQVISNVRIEGQISGLGTLVASGVQIPIGATSVTIPVTADTALPNSTALYDPMNITWKIASFDRYYQTCSQIPCQTFGVSASPVYVTLAVPSLSYVLGPPPTTPRAILPLPLTVLGLAVANGGAATVPAAFSNTWGRFSQGNPPQPGNITAWDPTRKLYYYRAGNGFSCALDPIELLSRIDGDGQCGSFARLLQWSLAANGITSTWVTVKTLDGTRMVVKNWTTPSQSSPDPPFYLWRITLNADDYMQPPPDPTKPTKYGDLFTESTLAAQNTAPPSEKVFDFHFIVQVDPGLAGGKGPYFDPSYGSWYADNGAFESQAIWGFVQSQLSGGGYPVRKPGAGPGGVCADPRLAAPACVNIKPFVP